MKKNIQNEKWKWNQAGAVKRQKVTKPNNFRKISIKQTCKKVYIQHWHSLFQMSYNTLLSSALDVLRCIAEGAMERMHKLGSQ